MVRLLGSKTAVATAAQSKPAGGSKTWQPLSLANPEAPNSKGGFSEDKDGDIPEATRFLGARPSEVRAAAKHARDRVRADNHRKEEVRKREAEAALRMKKIRDEMSGNRPMETVPETTSTNVKPTQNPWRPRRSGRPKRSLSNAEKVAVSRGAKELAMEELSAQISTKQRAKEEKKDQPHRRPEQRVVKEIANLTIPEDELDDLLTKSDKDMASSGARTPSSDARTPLPPRSPATPSPGPRSPGPRQARKSLESTRTGRLRRVGSSRRVERSPSNLVPEMRRRANQRDLLFVDDEGNHQQDKAQAAPSSRNDPTFSTNKSTGKDKGKNKPSSMMAAREAKEAAKVEEERQRQEAQRVELDKAKVHFDEGHDLCWKRYDSVNALVEYRKALFIRESLLGKYHEETGRSYFWIGKSLTKLKEYEEALMAFSRSVRIFERVLKRDSKYNIWAASAIESVFRQMEDTGVDLETYQATLESSIQHERDGDQFRKRGKLNESIAAYRMAIDNLDEYHPDAADLYCKIAIIMRQQGEFDRALEEYRYASEIYELSLGAEHPETVNTLNQLIEKKRLNQVSMALLEKLKMK